DDHLHGVHGWGLFGHLFGGWVDRIYSHWFHGLFPLLRRAHHVARTANPPSYTDLPPYPDCPSDGAAPRRHVGNPCQFHAPGYRIDDRRATGLPIGSG